MAGLVAAAHPGLLARAAPGSSRAPAPRARTAGAAPARVALSGLRRTLGTTCRAGDGSAEEPAEAAPAAAEQQQQQPSGSEGALQLEEGEDVYYEGSGAPLELAVSILMGITLIYLPLTLASIGRHLWIKLKITDRRIIITTSSPVFKREVQVAFEKVKEVRTVPRAFGAWGDMVVFLRDGSRLELVGVERAQEMKNYIEGRAMRLSRSGVE